MPAIRSWPANPEVLRPIQDHVETVNRDLSQDPRLAGSQIRRFLVLHKELDADDGEMTRTRKVRRGFVAEKYAAAGRGAVLRAGRTSTSRPR